MQALPRVGLIDPNALSRARTQRALTARGFDVTAAPGADVVSHGAGASPLHVIVFDVSLPMSDAFIRSTLAALPRSGHNLVLYSDRPKDDLDRLGREHAAARCVSKYDAGALFAAIESLCPADAPKPVPVSERRLAAAAAARDWKDFRILLVDDSEIVLSVIQDHLKQLGFDVRIAIALAEIESITQGWVPDVIVADVNMPEIRGDALCVRLKARLGFRSVGVILCSSIGDEELGALARSAGADGYVSKSHGADVVARRIREICQGLSDPMIVSS